ncbi:MAG: hypothetical protein JW726_14855 [Anaerolineales bacterium]|nr:hypothetical protein [Anaerolineales bacterium]
MNEQVYVDYMAKQKKLSAVYRMMRTLTQLTREHGFHKNGYKQGFQCYREPHVFSQRCGDLLLWRRLLLRAFPLIAMPPKISLQGVGKVGLDDFVKALAQEYKVLANN